MDPPPELRVNWGMLKRPRALLLIASLLSCKDPTQITVTVTTDAACSADASGKAIFNSVGVAGAREFPSKQAAAFNGSQDYCEAAPLVGSLVLVPADGRRQPGRGVGGRWLPNRRWQSLPDR